MAWSIHVATGHQQNGTDHEESALNLDPAHPQLNSILELPAIIFVGLRIDLKDGLVLTLFLPLVGFWLVVHAERVEVEKDPKWVDNPDEDPSCLALTQGKKNSQHNLEDGNCSYYECQVLSNTLDT